MSETTVVKGQFGLDQSGGPGKKLKIFCFTDMFLTPNYSTKAKQRHLINGFVQQHDYLCHCKNPAFHCLQILTAELAPQLSEKEKLQIKECLTTTAAATTTTEEDDHGLEDLEKLFAIEDTEDNNG